MTDAAQEQQEPCWQEPGQTDGGGDAGGEYEDDSCSWEAESSDSGELVGRCLPVQDIDGISGDFTEGVPDDADLYLAMVRAQAKGMPKVSVSSAPAPGTQRAPPEPSQEAARDDTPAAVADGDGDAGAGAHEAASDAGGEEDAGRSESAAPAPAPASQQVPKNLPRKYRDALRVGAGIALEEASALLDAGWVASAVAEFADVRAATARCRPPPLPAGSRRVHPKDAANFVARVLPDVEEDATGSGAGSKPTLSVVVGGMDRVASGAVLEAFVDEAEERGKLGELHASWLYALLCRVEDPLDAAAVASIRALARWSVWRLRRIGDAVGGVRGEEQAEMPGALSREAGERELPRVAVLLAVCGGFFRQCEGLSV
ncbi:unnamed protein product [Pedinophyceae sp. YPF-701]|nr:unnamed protein product [Pedinophyceae sp. YPF-701]